MDQLTLFDAGPVTADGSPVAGGLEPLRQSPPRTRKGVPYEVAVAVVVRDGTILLIRRQIEGMKSSWVLPGGKINPGESPHKAAQREVLEETGVACRPVRTLRSRIHPVSGKKIVYVLCDYCDSYSRENREYGFRWVAARNVPKMLGRTLSEKLKADIHSLGMARRARAGLNPGLESCALFAAAAAVKA